MYEILRYNNLLCMVCADCTKIAPSKISCYTVHSKEEDCSHWACDSTCVLNYIPSLVNKADSDIEHCIANKESLFLCQAKFWKVHVHCSSAWRTLQTALSGSFRDSKVVTVSCSVSVLQLPKMIETRAKILLSEFTVCWHGPINVQEQDRDQNTQEDNSSFVACVINAVKCVMEQMK